jgi:Protein of unknown function, DUF417
MLGTANLGPLTARPVGEQRVAPEIRVRSSTAMAAGDTEEDETALMNQFTRNVDVITGHSGVTQPPPSARSLMNSLTRRLIKLGILTEDLDYHVIRASMVIIFLFFGYQKWWEYEAQVLIPYISNGPLIFWIYPAFGIRGASWFFGRLGMVVWHAVVFGVLG